jgi:hypothetical protein
MEANHVLSSISTWKYNNKSTHVLAMYVEQTQGKEGLVDRDLQYKG